jgi:hypothetical protein
MTTEKELESKIRKELEEGIIRNKVLPLDWAMDRIRPHLKESQKGMIKIEDVNNQIKKRIDKLLELRNENNKLIVGASIFELEELKQKLEDFINDGVMTGEINDKM